MSHTKWFSRKGSATHAGRRSRPFFGIACFDLRIVRLGSAAQWPHRDEEVLSGARAQQEHSGLPRRSLKMLGLFVCLLAIAACGGQMSDQPRCEPLEKSTFFQDERCSRHLVAGTVPRGALRDDPILFTGQMSEASAATGERGPAAGQDEETNQTDQQEGNQSGETAIPGGGEEGQQGGQQAAQANQNLADAFPFAVTLDVLEVGQERYNIYCAPCHDRAGTGNGMIVRRGFAQPPSLHIDRLRDAPVGHYFDVITNGWGAMPSYSAQVPVRDRWAIIAYIRALQLSQNASIEDVPADARDQLEGGEQQQ